MSTTASVKSCTLLAVAVDGASVTTVEGLGKPDALHPMQLAFHENHGLQCGFCTPGMLMSSVEFAKRHPNPTEADVRHWLEGNLCRCTGYQNIVNVGAARHRRDACRTGSMKHVKRHRHRRPAAPQGGSALPDRPRQLCRRHQAAGHGDGRVRTLAACARRESSRSTRPRRLPCRACSPCSPAKISRPPASADCPAAGASPARTACR